MVASKASATIALLLGLTLFANVATASLHRAASHMIEFANDSEEKLVVDWQNPETGERVEFMQLLPGQTLPVKSFVNHTFVIHSVNETCSGDDNVCRGTAVTVNDNEDQGERERPMRTLTSYML